MIENKASANANNGITLIICRICGIKRYVETRQYRGGLPDTCIKCAKGLTN